MQQASAPPACSPGRLAEQIASIGLSPQEILSSNDGLGESIRSQVVRAAPRPHQGSVARLVGRWSADVGSVGFDVFSSLLRIN